jgi:hypothetical protein
MGLDVVQNAHAIVEAQPSSCKLLGGFLRTGGTASAGTRCAGEDFVLDCSFVA